MGDGIRYLSAGEDSERHWWWVGGMSMARLGMRNRWFFSLFRGLSFMFEG